LLRQYIGAAISPVVPFYPVISAFRSFLLYVIVSAFQSFQLFSGRCGHWKQNKFLKEKRTKQFTANCLYLKVDGNKK